MLTLAAQFQRTSTVTYSDRADFAVDLSAVAAEPRVAQLDDPPACRPNLVMYWGQNSWGGQHLDDPPNWEKDIDYYCQDDTVDVIIASFLINYNLGGIPGTNFANHCNETFPNTQLHHCASITDGIRYCQKRGKKILLSLGGAEGRYGFPDDKSAVEFARVIHNLYLGGKSDLRPFDDVVLDGIDLDLEHGGPTGVTAFVTELRRLSVVSNSPRRLIISAAPQCEYPDANLGRPLEEADIDMVLVQFYNNWCGLMNFDNIWAWNYPVWHKLIGRMVNKNAKIYIGAPSAPAAGRGFVNLTRLTQIYRNISSTYDSVGGMMLWDVSNGWNNYDDIATIDGPVARRAGGKSLNFAQATGRWLHRQSKCPGNVSIDEAVSAGGSATVTIPSTNTSKAGAESTSDTPGEEDRRPVSRPIRNSPPRLSRPEFDADEFISFAEFDDPHEFDSGF
ncbi:Chitinase 2 [Tieghemiomyces parasiticus]|uniref:chitinase n=1 Tax=Tieghemiomyces parasiticus TaxID=78921 RepID=A0A9W8AGG7_9FUNG|nr:Chitinase 2 [Tieghemiomyces parasiticus]